MRSTQLNFIYLILPIICASFACSKQKKPNDGGPAETVVIPQGVESCFIEARIDLETASSRTADSFNDVTRSGVELHGNHIVTATNCDGQAVGQVDSLVPASPGRILAQRYQDGASQNIVINFNTAMVGNTSYLRADGTTLSAKLNTACSDGMQAVGQWISGQTQGSKITMQYRATYSYSDCTPNQELNFLLP